MIEYYYFTIFPSIFYRIHDEIARLEKLQKLAEKVHQEAKVTDSKLDDIEAWIEEEAKRVDHLHPKGKKHALKKYDQFTLNTSCF